jgi:hypothetical protein
MEQSGRTCTTRNTPLCRARKRRFLWNLKAHEHANERWFEEAEQLVSFANRLGEIFAKDEPGQKMRF